MVSAVGGLGIERAAAPHSVLCRLLVTSAKVPLRNFSVSLV